VRDVVTSSRLEAYRVLERIFEEGFAAGNDAK